LLLAATEVFGAAASSAEVALFFSIFSLAGLGIATANYWALTQTVVPSGAIGGSVVSRTWQVTLRASQRLFLQVGLYNLQVTTRRLCKLSLYC